MVDIISVNKGSLAERAGIRSGDTIVSINGHEVCDVLDYRFYLADTRLDLCVERKGERLEIRITKGMYSDIGLSFETALMDEKHSCENKCIFCFIDQLPKGMRKSLYFKDDDSRLSFLHGNYITLTNMKQRDIDRIIEMHISPVNISVHTTNPELRVAMMKNKHSGEVLRYMRQLADAGIRLRAQIVLCRGVNDGEELDRTMADLAGYFPALESVSVVPAGLTAYREGLYPLAPFTVEETAQVIQQVTSFGDACLEKYGTRIFYCADEMYVRAGILVPEYAFWGEFTQIENGVGMLSSFAHEFEIARSLLTPEEKAVERHISIATGETSYAFINDLVKRLAAICPRLDCRVYKIKNNFFGGEVSVTGLITGEDLISQLSDKPLGDALLLSRSMLRAEGDLFLCDKTPEDVARALAVPLFFVENDGGSFVDAVLGIGGMC